MLLESRRVNQRTQGAHRAALFADYLSHVCLGDAHLDPGGAFTLNFPHVDCFRVINQSLDDYFNGFAHIQGPRSKVFVVTLDVGLSDCFRCSTFRLRGLLNQLANSIGRLRAFFDPVTNSVGLQLNLCRLARRIVRSKVLKVRAVAL